MGIAQFIPNFRYLMVILVLLVLSYLSTQIFSRTWDIHISVPGFSNVNSQVSVVLKDNQTATAPPGPTKTPVSVVTGESKAVTTSPPLTIVPVASVTPVTTNTSVMPVTTNPSVTSVTPVTSVNSQTNVVTATTSPNKNVTAGDGRGQFYLDKILAGHWSPRNHTARELEEVEVFIQRTHTYHKLPAVMQREDKKCGNNTLEGPNLQWYRALCDQKGAAPCCMDNVCVNKTTQECRCPECYDLRQQIHAELATWVPDDPTVNMTQFTTETAVCGLLQNQTIYFVGDSFTRQIYTSLLAILRKDKPRHVLSESVSQENFAKCDNYYRYFADCRNYLLFNTKECNGTLQLNMEYFFLVGHLGTFIRLIRYLRGIPDSWFLIGIGYHNKLDADLVIQNVFEPLFKELSASPWPKMVWMSMHSPGILKTPFHQTEQISNVLIFNAKMKTVMDANGIPVLNYVQLTNGTMSYDGSHYGKGINDAKLQIILNYINFIRERDSSTNTS